MEAEQKRFNVRAEAPFCTGCHAPVMHWVYQAGEFYLQCKEPLLCSQTGFADFSLRAAGQGICDAASQEVSKIWTGSSDAVAVHCLLGRQVSAFLSCTLRIS